ncbi:MAG: MgtC/SapB family protein [Actinomycetota bacterium]
MPDQGDLILRLLLAATLAGVLGVERELTEQPAGFRTHILVGVGAALFAVISTFGFQAIAGLGPTSVVRADITRTVSQIVVGIGFLGGGAILKYGASVRGLTTAASLWITAAIGTAVGIGMLVIGTATTAIGLVALVGLRPLRALVRRYAINRDEFLVQGPPELDVDAVVARVKDSAATLMEMRITEEAGERTIHMAVRLPRELLPADFVSVLAGVGRVRAVEWVR